MVVIGGEAGPHRVRPADPLKPGRDLGVIEVRVIAALVADEFKRPGVAFHPAPHDAGWLAPQARGAAVAGLASKRKCRKTLIVTARRQATRIARAARHRNCTQAVGRPRAGGDVGVSRAHQSPPPSRWFLSAGVRSSTTTPVLQRDRLRATPRTNGVPVQRTWRGREKPDRMPEGRGVTDTVCERR
jgi:hypothetical protein